MLCWEQGTAGLAITWQYARPTTRPSIEVKEVVAGSKFVD